MTLTEMLVEYFTLDSWCILCGGVFEMTGRFATCRKCGVTYDLDAPCE